MHFSVSSATNLATHALVATEGKLPGVYPKKYIQEGS